ncbi:MAG TPA: hypothetical protein VHN79_03580, partial [Lacunisphaera sp.]|nr:hypothetical protein [Lacunisphaera sp.]
FGRGRGVREYGVTVQRFFSSLAAAVQFCLTHEDTLPVQADLTFVDSTAGIALTMANAVGQARIAQRLGVCVVIEYTFTGARFESDDVPDAPEDSESVKAATIALAENDESKVITFDVPFGATPRFVGVTVLAPSGELGFAAWVDDSTLDAAGFTVRLGAAVPAAGYKLSWSAIL